MDRYARVLLIFIGTFVVYLRCPVIQLADSRYSMLLSAAILRSGSVDLSDYTIKENGSIRRLGSLDHFPSQLERVNGRVLYFYPHGTSWLSAPFVAVFESFGISPVSSDRGYDLLGELKIQKALASFLAAAFIVGVFLLAAQMLSPSQATLIAWATAFATPVFSTVSRATWSHDWEILLVVGAIFLMVRESGDHEPRGGAIALLLWLAFFARPNAAIDVCAVGTYLLLFHRNAFLRFAVVSIVCAAIFVGYSIVVSGHLLPRVYSVYRFNVAQFLAGLAGALVSPSHGLLIYEPIVLLMAWLLVRGWSELPKKRLAAMAVSIVAAHLLLVSGWWCWWGGTCWGPRLMTDAVPWFALLGVILMAPSRVSAPALVAERRYSNGIRILAAGLIAISIFLNAVGAISWSANDWTTNPVDANVFSGRLWDWSDPPFLRPWRARASNATPIS